jgi:TonB-linked SusC/RagA family outer membrane protein
MIMKTTLILLFSMMFCAVAENGLSQNARVSINKRNFPLREALGEIENQTDYLFIYNNDVDANATVSVRANQTPVFSVLNSILKDKDMAFEMEGTHIIISKRENDADQTVTVQQPARKNVSGSVVDSKGEPMIGVNIIEKGTTNGTISDIDGKFNLSVDESASLFISFIGYENIELSTVGRTTFNVVLQESVTSLDEMVVVGYGVQKRQDLTGSISSLSGKTMIEIPVANPSQALQGRSPGISVINNGSPGEKPIVRIRGISSISFSSDPLYVVDGMPVRSLESFDVNDIKSLDILKDASASAIYGSRATNGVVVVTTKNGQNSGKINVSYNGSAGFQTVTKRLDLLDLEGFKKYAIAYRGQQVPRLQEPWLSTPIYPGASQTYGETNTDWQDEYFKTGFMTSHNVGINGGNNISKFSSSIGIFDQEGTIPTARYKRYNFRINSDHNIGDHINFGQELYISSGDKDYVVNDDVTGARTNLVNVIRMMPFIPVYDPTTNGGFRGVNSALDGGDPTNPIEDAKLKYPANENMVKLLGTMHVDVNLTKWLTYRSMFGLDYSNGLNYRFQPIFNDGGNIAGSSSSVATITNNRHILTNKMFSNQLTFNKSFDDHHLNVIAVYEFQNEDSKSENANGQQESNELKTLNNAKNVFVQTLDGENSMISYVGRLNYDFKNKYYLNFTVRRDGLSVWAPGKKWETFPSISLGWRIDKESFMKNQTVFELLKIRGGYGITGLNGALLGNSPWQASVISNSSLYPFNNSLNGGLGSSIQRLGNKDLEWELTKQTNIGVDMGLLNNKVSLTFDFYKRETDNLILDVPLPPSMGFIHSSVAQNAGAMENSGFEFSGGYRDTYGDLTWYVNTNFSIVKNKVTRLAEGVTNIEAGANPDFGGYSLTNTMVGESIQSFYGWQVDGIFQNNNEVTNSPFQTLSTSPGDIKFVNRDGNNVINLDDRKVLGSFMPKFSYGFDFGVNYKNFDLSVMFQGVQGNKIYNATKVVTEGMIRFFNAGVNVLDAWTPSNTDSRIPRAIASDPNGNARTSNRFIEDGSYLRMKNITLGYVIPSSILQNITNNFVKNFRVYISGQNLLTITDYSGYDPEVGNRTPNSSLTNGIDYAVYPQPKAVQFGVQVGF